MCEDRMKDHVVVREINMEEESRERVVFSEIEMERK